MCPNQLQSYTLSIKTVISAVKYTYTNEVFNLLYADTQLEDREFPIASSEVEMFLFLQTFRRCIYIFQQQTNLFNATVAKIFQKWGKKKIFYI